MERLRKYEIRFYVKNGDSYDYFTWERFAPDVYEAQKSARAAIEREYGEPAYLSVELVA
ncbi:hypothetical protein LCGC14_1016220 [marine sediment metagenome]|uniref:Uncharacterized protein n=1 Tax=marine sediment metagenome TaxID=412755 RepID=A0A0F9MYP7_9ZZZZ